MRRLSAAYLLVLAGFAWFSATSSAADAKTSTAASDVEVHRNANKQTVGFVVAQVGAGKDILVYGLSLPGIGGRRQMLVRAGGPVLTALDIEGALDDPAVAVFDAKGQRIFANDDWISDDREMREATTRAGALPFAANSRDAAVIADLPPGNYTVEVRSVSGATGKALVEVYDVTPGTADNAVVFTPGRPPKPNPIDPDQLLLHLALTENFNDETGNPVALRMRGVTIRNGAAWFDGNGSELVFPHQPLDHTPFAVALWIKVENDFPTTGLVEQRSANRRNQHLHLMLRETMPHLGFYVNDLRPPVAITPARGWTHLVFQYTGDQQEIWLNGECVGTRHAQPYAGRRGEFAVGRTPRWTNVPSTDFKGGMRNLFVYGRALSPSEIATLASDSP